MRKIVIAFLLLISQRICAQTDISLSALVAAVKAPYEYLDSTKTSTGYLMDQAVDFVKVGLFDGRSLCDSNYVDISLYRDIFRTMNYARVNADKAASYNADSIYESMTSAQYIKLSSALFQYNYIIEGAISDELIDYNSSTDRFYDHFDGGIWQNPYDEDYVFMFTASQHIYHGSAVTYDISDLIAYTNCDITNSSVWIDFGNGVYVDSQSLSSPHQVIYNYEGTKELRLKIILGNNDVLESHSSVTIVPQSMSPSGASNNNLADTIIPLEYGNIRASLSIKYHPNHNGVAKKPFIYVEGFDHPVLCGLQRLDFSNLCEVVDSILYSRCNDNYHINSKLDSAIVDIYEYDLCYVNWENPEASILDNAELLKMAIRAVNNRKPSDGSGDRTVLAAHSMGGLIARCALRQMEMNGELHQIDYYISQDVPHLGAVVPIGAQYMLRDLHHYFFGHNGNAGLGWIPPVKAFADKIVGILDCDSARQMMCEYVDNDGTIDNSIHNQFMSYLNSIGFPRGDIGHPIENLAIVSGNAIDSYELSEKILEIGVSLTKLHVITPPYLPKNLTIYSDIDRDRQSGTTVSSTIVAYTHFTRSRPLWVIPLMVFNHTSSSSTGHYDVVPGSFLDLKSPSGIWCNNPFLYVHIADKMVFVPAASALAVPGYDASNYDSPSSFVSDCPFDSYCFEEHTMSHSTRLDKYLFWIDHQKSMTASVPPLVINGDVFSVGNIPPVASSGTWSSSNNSIASINNGVITVANPGPVTLSYHSTHEQNKGGGSIQYRYYSKHRKVLAGFPAMTLSYSHYSGNQYVVSAQCTSTDNELRSKLDELAYNGDISFVWAYKVGENSYVIQDTTSTRTFTATAPAGEATRVVLWMCNTLNGIDRTSEPNTITIDRRSNTPFYYEPSTIYSIPNDQICNYNYMSGTTVASNQYLAVWRNASYYPAPSAPTNVLIDNEVLPLETTTQISIDGVSTLVYCFDLFSSSTVQAALISPPLPHPFNPPSPFPPAVLPTLLPVKIRNGNTVLQEFILTIYYE